MKHFVAGLVMILLLTTTARSQHAIEINITGIVSDSVNVLPGAAVSILRHNDSALIRTVQTDEQGRFRITGPAAAGYLLRVSFVGYYPEYRHLTTDGSTRSDTIRMKLQPGALKEVQVVRRKPAIDQRIDMTVIHITETLQQEAPNALDILKLAPGILVSDNEDEVTMNGKDGVEVMLNGKIVHLTGRDLLKLLKSIPTNAVNQVEVISNPSVKYDVRGNRGILNIRIKRNVTGWNGNLDITSSQGKHNMGDATTTIHYGTGKFYVSGYLGYHYGNYQTSLTEQRYVLQDGTLSTFNKTNISLEKWSDPVIRIGTDFFLNSRNTFGALVELERSSNHSTYNSQTKISTINQADDTILLTRSYAPHVQHWNTCNLNYHYAGAHCGGLNIDLDRSYFKNTKDNTLSNAYLAGNGISDKPGDQLNTMTNIDIITIKTDYTKNFINDLKLETGLKSSFVNTTNNLQAYIVSAPGIRADSNQTNFFTYRERVNAAYANISKKLGKWGLQAGLRFERSNVAGNSVDITGKTIHGPDSTYYNLLPSVFVSFSPSRKHHLLLSFIQKLTRPDYENLQPFTYQTDPFTYHTGNPSLKPQINSNIELAYTFNETMTFSAAYIHTTNYFNPVNYQTGNIQYEFIANTGTSDEVNFSMNVPVRFTKWWSGNNKLNCTYNYFKGTVLNGTLHQGKWGYSLYTSQRFILPARFIFTVTARYTSAYRRLIYYYKDAGSIAASIAKRFFNNRSQVKIGINDILRTNCRNFDVNFTDLHYARQNTWESRRVFIELAFRFGKDNARQPRDRDTGNGDERNRTGK